MERRPPIAGASVPRLMIQLIHPALLGGGGALLIVNIESQIRAHGGSPLSLVAEGLVAVLLLVWASLSLRPWCALPRSPHVTVHFDPKDSLNLQFFWNRLQQPKRFGQ